MATQPTAALAPASAAGAAAGAMPTPPGLIGPDGKLSLAAVRRAYPMYSDLTDDQLLIGLHQKMYPDVSPRQFYGAVNYDTDRAKLDPTADMGPMDKLVAGYGKTTSDVIDTAKRLGNAVGLGNYDQAAAQEDQRIAAPLMATGLGKTGNIMGDIAMTAIPAAKTTQGLVKGGRVLVNALPAGAARTVAAGAVPLAAAAGTGAGVGAALSPEDPAGGAEAGAIMGPVGEVGGRVAQGIYQGGKAVVEPLWDAGRQRILKRTMDRFATDPNAVRAALASPDTLVPGRTPTLAEQTGDTGIAQLQRGAQIMPPVATAMSDANSERMRAYKAVLDDLAGNDGKREFFDAAREGNAQQNYGNAYAAGLEGMTPELQQTFDSLLQRPAIADAIPTAQTIAANSGMPIDNASGSVAGMHYIKKALDNQISGLGGANQGTMQSSVMDARKAFIDALRQGSPKYGAALDQYAADSAPLNQMAIGQVLRDKMVPALGDYSDDLARGRAESYAQALRDSAGTARRATGLDSATLENTLTPQQMQGANNIATDAARYAQSQEAGRIPGSPTAQYLGAQNILAQSLGPLGAGPALLDSAAGRATAGVLSLPFRATASKTEEMLARALRDPAFAAQILSAKDAAPLIAKLQPGAANAAVVANDK